MTATPESLLLDELFAAGGSLEVLIRHVATAGSYCHPPYVLCNKGKAAFEAVRQAVEAYGRACRLAELRDTAECTCVWRDMEKTILHRQCDRCDRIAELEAEG